MYLDPSLHICTLRKLYIHKLIDIINCLMKQEEVKLEKIKTRRLSNVETQEEFIWQRGNKEIQNIKYEIKPGKSWKFKLVKSHTDI